VVTLIPDPTIRACVTADEAFAELGIDRTTGYRAIKEGTFPVPVIRVGRLIRVPTAALRQLLDLASPDDSRTDDTYPDDPTADTAGESPTLRLVPRPELAHQRTQAAMRPERTGGQP
jgi:predicted DNA-binding transcriptional regulator AlpA